MSDDKQEIAIAGRRFRLALLTVGMLLEIERRVLAEVRDPLQVIAERWEDFSDAQRRELLEAAFERLSRPAAVPLAELVAWMNAPQGTAFAFWLCAREFQPELAWEDCQQMLLHSPPEVLERIQHILAPEWWEDTLGNSPGQTQPVEVAARGDAFIAS